MEFIGGFLMVIASVGWLVAIVGLVRPSLLASKGLANAPTRGTIVMGMVGLFVIFIIGIFLLPDPKTGQTSEVSVTQSAASQASVQRLNIGLAEWVDTMNALSRKVGMDSISVMEDKSSCPVLCVTSYRHGPFVRYLVSHKDGRINELVMFAGGNGTAESGAEILLAMVTLVRALADNPDEQSIPSATAALAHDLTTRGSGDVTIAGVHYTAKNTRDLGTMIVASR
ncbi:hypothetical protein [Paraburkholderia fungorum]|uniref:hypothetical protein n=1 Tax=Paraburkholderia fungorum TaxID=134537 RepID=UPI00402BD058